MLRRLVNTYNMFKLGHNKHKIIVRCHCCYTECRCYTEPWKHLNCNVFCLGVFAHITLLYWTVLPSILHLNFTHQEQFCNSHSDTCRADHLYPGLPMPLIYDLSYCIPIICLLLSSLLQFQLFCRHTPLFSFVISWS